jgi:hypothetical protein
LGNPDVVARVRIDSKADFFGRERPVTLRVKAGSDVNPGRFPMSFRLIASRLSVVTAYIAFAFVGAIVLGVF